MSENVLLVHLPSHSRSAVAICGGEKWRAELRVCNWQQMGENVLLVHLPSHSRAAVAICGGGVGVGVPHAGGGNGGRRDAAGSARARMWRSQLTRKRKKCGSSRPQEARAPTGTAGARPRQARPERCGGAGEGRGGEGARRDSVDASAPRRENCPKGTERRQRTPE